MASLYIYMQVPDSLAVITLGRVNVEKGIGEFVYNPDYVKSGGWVPDPIRYPLRAQPYSNITTNRGIPGFIRDAAPDGWGERLVTREHGELDAIGFLHRSPNHDRAGNLMAGSSRAAPDGIGQAGLGTITQLETFIQFADGVQGGFPPGTDRATKATLQQRSSLGGARPKCTLIHENRLILAKPQDRHDAYDIPSLEYACMSFAASKGLNAARVQLHAGRVNTLLVDRFDREPAGDGRCLRLPMLSGLTLLDSDWNNQKSWARWHYGFLADEMSRRGVSKEDLQELFKRICFNILVGNDDDHPKNVAVLYREGGWRLSPMYDVVPNTEGSPPARLAMGIGRYGHEISRRNLLSQVEHYGLSQEQAEVIIDEVIGWAPDLKAHYLQCLREPELGLAAAAMGAHQLQA
ncbi:type II toxin-antitoxin system HipA family toxin [Pseudomonas entomophila]|uniref:type II toxin-antitoxin system HipA family toxin n=1 Tax=Pseudomonas entomophila TaxID=312306 RepID=UPI0023D87601|nr:type II toxin-antitoxin system HipA family toxin [Pseudomonas entomophila]MDF0729130.1 type II toxin-antitoxin system HipA family toxin [Pseudomonas entomophila]